MTYKWHGCPYFRLAILLKYSHHQIKILRTLQLLRINPFLTILDWLCLIALPIYIGLHNVARKRGLFLAFSHSSGFLSKVCHDVHTCNLSLGKPYTTVPL